MYLLAVEIHLGGPLDRTNPQQHRSVERLVSPMHPRSQVTANAASSIADASNRAVGDGELCGDLCRASVVIHVGVPVGSGVHLLTMRYALWSFTHNAYPSARGGGENVSPGSSRSP